MGVFLKYISKNMLERKGRLFLLIFSIMISVALLVASLGLIDSVVDSYVQPYEIAAEGQDISIHSNTDANFFAIEDINAKGIEDLKGCLSATGIMNDNDEVKYVRLDGRKDLDIKMVEGSFENTKEPTIVISDRIADEYGIKKGDKLKVAIDSKATEFTVSGIASNDGMFYTDKKKSFSAVVPYEFLNEKLGAQGKFNRVTAKMSDKDAKVKDVVADFNDANENVKASALFDIEMIGTESLTLGLYAMLALVCIVCVINSYSHYFCLSFALPCRRGLMLRRQVIPRLRNYLIRCITWSSGLKVLRCLIRSISSACIRLRVLLCIKARNCIMPRLVIWLGRTALRLIWSIRRKSK